MWYQGVGGGARNVKFQYMHMKHDVRLTGVSPSKIDSCPVFEGCNYIHRIKADWKYYLLHNSSANSVIVDVAPSHAFINNNGEDTFGIVGSGKCLMDPDAGGAGIPGVTDIVFDGNIHGMFYDGTGVVKVEIEDDYPDVDYLVIAMSSANRSIGILTQEPDRFKLENRNIFNDDLDDFGKISFIIKRI